MHGARNELVAVLCETNIHVRFAETNLSKPYSKGQWASTDGSACNKATARQRDSGANGRSLVLAAVVIASETISWLLMAWFLRKHVLRSFRSALEIHLHAFHHRRICFEVLVQNDRHEHASEVTRCRLFNISKTVPRARSACFTARRAITRHLGGSAQHERYFSPRAENVQQLRRTAW